MDRFPLRLKLLATSLVAMVAMGAATPSSAAEKMDIETHTLLIEKLDRVVGQGESTNVANTEVRLRLADLLAERARLHGLKAQGKDSAAARNDRKRALSHYQAVVNKTDAERRATVLLQMAHLHEASGEQTKAVAIYQRMEREGARVYPRASVGLAISKWGEIYYRKGEFSKALGKFQTALKLSDQDRHGHIQYRIAWSNLNLGRLEVATQGLVRILRTPELLIRKSSEGEDLDVSFHEDAARDLVIFIARGHVNAQSVELLLELSPDRIRRENLRNLALETERLGKKKEAIFVWGMILEDDPTDIEKIDGRVRIATLEWGLNNKREAAQQLENAIAIWKKEGCKDKEECPPIKARMRKLIVDWNRLEKDRVTPELAKAYAVYNAYFNEEYDMFFWAAQVSRLLKRYNDASLQYRTSSILAHKELKQKENKDIRKMFEAALIAQIEMAESGGNLNVKEAAYDHYLNLNPNGPRALEVRYQRARVYYDKKQYAKAADEFRAVALTDAKSQADMRKKAADLALDSLVLGKEEKNIEPWAFKFASVFPAARVEYLSIARRAILKDVAAVSNNAKSSEGELKNAARRLREVPLDGATSDERRLIFRNHLVLAVRTRDLAETDRAADRLLAHKGIPAEDTEFALEKKVWAAEMRLDFERAYRLTQKMDLGKVREDDRQMRLAYLAELAGRRASSHYETVIKTSRNKAKLELAATRLIRASSRPWNELQRLEHIVGRNRDLHAELVLELYARTGDERKANMYLKNRAIARTAAGQTIIRSMEIRKINALDRQIAKHRIITASDRLMNTTLTRRLGLLKDVETSAAAAIRAQDFMLQAITLSIVARENSRLHDELLKMPIPSRLKPAEKEQYAKALKAQAAPFKQKAKEAADKVEEFWDNDKAIDLIAENIEKSIGPVTRILADEARQFSSRAPGSVRSRLDRAIARSGDRPSTEDIISARRALARDPFSERQAEKLKAMEAELGRDAMVTYLDARLSQLRGGVK